MEHCDEFLSLLVIPEWSTMSPGEEVAHSWAGSLYRQQPYMSFDMYDEKQGEYVYNGCVSSKGPQHQVRLDGHWPQRRFSLHQIIDEQPLDQAQAPFKPPVPVMNKPEKRSRNDMLKGAESRNVGASTEKVAKQQKMVQQQPVVKSKTERVVEMASEKRKTSKYTGVCWYRRTKRWVVQIKLNGDRVHIGYFEDEARAGNSYKKAIELKKSRPEISNDELRTLALADN